jgi:hypothetical protein
MEMSIKQMPANARVWVYQSNRTLSGSEISAIAKAGKLFIEDWAAHGANLKASLDILYNRFIVIAVDEQQALASGCSIDKSVRFIKDIEQQLHLNFFDRMQITYRGHGNELLSCSFSEFEKLASQNIVNPSTIVFNNMVTTKQAFDQEWEVPLKQSWQSRVLA